VIALLLAPLLWPLVLALLIPLHILGWPVVGYLAYTYNWVPRVADDMSRVVLSWSPRWAWLWGNQEDGVLGDTLWRRKWALRPRLGALLWSANRNPTNNFRFVPLFNPKPVPDRIRFWGNHIDPSRREQGLHAGVIRWAFTWQGVYSGFVWRCQLTSTRHFQVRLGWKFLPKDVLGIEPTDYRYARMPFCVQLHPYRLS